MDADTHPCSVDGAGKTEAEVNDWIADGCTAQGDSGGGSPFVDGPCDEASWPDLDHDLVCGECKVLVDNIRDYGTCDRYCRSLPNPRRCTGAWEEDGDSCAVESEHSCDWRPRSTSDALCECSDECTGDECGIALGPPPSFCEDDCVTVWSLEDQVIPTPSHL